MAVLKNRAGVATSTTGTGTITLGSALGSTAINNASWQTFAGAGVVNSDSVQYLILDSNGAWEYGPGTYSSSGTTLSRPAGAMNGTVAGQRSSTGSLLSLSGSAQVFITALAEDFSAIGFSAHKNGTNQTLNTGETTKITFTTEDYDRGSFYDAANSRWIPPAGMVNIEIVIFVSAGIVAGSNLNLFCYKNGSVVKQCVSAVASSGSGTGGVIFGFIDIANGTDIYEVYFVGSASATAFTVSGTAVATFFMGHFVGR